MRRVISQNVVKTALYASLLSISLPPNLMASPFSMSYSGRLATETGAGVVGPVKLEVKFFKVASGGTAIGVSPIVKNSVSLSDGVFQIDLTELSLPEYHLVLDSLTSTWIEIKDATNAKIYPRQKLTAVPFAMKVPVDGVTVTYDSDGKLKAENGLPAGGTNGQYLKTDGGGTFSWATPSGTGDMLASTYDTVGSAGVVDNAEDAIKLGGQSPAYYQNATNINSGIIGYSYLPVGTTATTIAAGNDSRFTDARSPTGAASGDLTGTYPAPTLAASVVTAANMAASSVSGGPAGTIADSSITDADISTTAAIADTKLAIISTAGKVSGNAITTGTISGANIDSTGYIKSSNYFATGNGAPFKFYGTQSRYIGLSAPATGMGSDYVVELPASAPTTGNVLTATSSTQLAWSAPAPSMAPGSNQNILFNNNTATDAASGLNWNSGVAALGVGTTTPGAQVHMVNTNSSRSSLIVTASSAPSADIFRIESSGSMPHVAVKPDGLVEAQKMRVTGAQYVAVRNDSVSSVTIAQTDYFLTLDFAGSVSVALPACSAPEHYGRVLKFLRKASGTVTFNGPAAVFGNTTFGTAGEHRTAYCSPLNRWEIE